MEKNEKEGSPGMSSVWFFYLTYGTYMVVAWKKKQQRQQIKLNSDTKCDQTRT
jgi:peroxiredoxin